MSMSLNQRNLYGGIVKQPSDNPLILFQPFNIIVFLSFFSPVIVAVIIVSMSFLFQNFKGFIYLGFLIGICVVRNYLYMLFGSKAIETDGSICNSIQYSKYGNATFSAFVFAFTMMYLFLPMFSNGSINFWVVSGLLCYFFIDVFIKIYKKCLLQVGDLFINILFGLASAGLIVTLMYSGGSSKYLFFNETQSNKEICSMPKQQTFKCNVFKNGELIGSV